MSSKLILKALYDKMRLGLIHEILMRVPTSGARVVFAARRLDHVGVFSQSEHFFDRRAT